MEKRKKSKNLIATERRYFVYCFVSCIAIFLIGLLFLETMFILFEVNPVVRLFLFALDFAVAAYGSYRIGKTNWIQKLIDAIHQ